MILLLSILTNALEAIYEGLYDNGKKTIAGILELIQKAVGVFTVAYITSDLLTHHIYIPIWKLIVGFILIRFLIFDYIYNITRGLSLTYIGNTKLYDKFLNTVPGHFIAFVKIILGLMGTCFLLGLS